MLFHNTLTGGSVIAAVVDEKTFAEIGKNAKNN